MTRFSQGEKPEEKPPWTLADGLSDRARAIDSEVKAWEHAHPAPEVKRPSELKRGSGLRLIHRFGIAVCMRRPGVRSRSKRFLARSCERICGYLVIMERGQKLVKCHGCGQRIWVKYTDVVFQHDDLRVIKDTIQYFREWRGRRPRAIVGLALFNGWAMRAEEKLAMRAFYAYMPWNLPNFRG